MVEYYLTPNYWIVYNFKPTSIVLHSTRGGSGSRHGLEVEYDATVNWFGNTVSIASTHAVVSPTRIAYLLPTSARYPNIPHKTGRDGLEKYPYWHLNIGFTGIAPHCLGIEFTQEFEGDPYSSKVIENGLNVIEQWCRTYDIPASWIADPRGGLIKTSSEMSGLICHQNVRLGKTDPGSKFPYENFIKDLQKSLQPNWGGVDLESEVQELRTKLNFLEVRFNNHLGDHDA
jgi:hypothetical protein